MDTDDAFDEILDEIDGQIAQSDAYNASDKAQDQGFGHKLEDDILILGTDRPTDTDFTGSFGDRDQHDIHNSDSSDNKRDSSDSSEEKLHSISDGTYSGDNIRLRCNRKISIISISDIEMRKQGLLNKGFRGIDSVSSRDRKRYIGEVFRSEKPLLGSRERYENRTISISEIRSSFLLHDSDNGQYDIAETDIFSDRIGWTEQRGRCSASQYSDLIYIIDILLTDERSILYRRITYRKIGRKDTIDRDLHIVGAIDGLRSTSVFRRDGGNIRKVSYDIRFRLGKNVLRASSSFSASDIGLARSSGCDRQKIRSQCFYIGQDRLLGSLTDSEKYDNRKDTDDDTQRTECRS